MADGGGGGEEPADGSRGKEKRISVPVPRLKVTDTVLPASVHIWTEQRATGVDGATPSTRI